MRKIICLCSIFVFISVLVPEPLIAGAGEWISSQQAFSTVKNVSDISSVTEDIHFADGSEVTFETGDQTVTLDTQSQEVEVSSSESEAPSFSVQLPTSSAVNVADSGSGLVMRDRESSCSTTLEAGDGFFRSCFVIDNETAPRDYSLDFELPSDISLRYAKGADGNEDGSIEGCDKQGNTVLAVALPWAIDANGNRVSTRYELIGDTLTQVVDCDGLDSSSFPVVADPLVSFSTWFDSYKWKKVKTLKSASWKGKKTGWSLSLVPSMALKVATIALPFASLGQPIASNVVGAAFVNSAWSQAYAKCHKSSHWKNTKSLKQQFYCHFYLLAAKRVTKGSWFINIEPKRPAVGIAKNIAASCNP